ncbi:heterokaryon incompatibility protein-domain-containing protein [Rostrohypoxylon terebratum]|nr:heterokaryon incompatibility protein-domain-containing protein [Rostrohypoxylon terebratum]
MTSQSVWNSETCPGNICQYFNLTKGGEIYSILHRPCDSCPSQIEQEPLCGFCRHLRLYHLAMCPHISQGLYWNLGIKHGFCSDEHLNKISRILAAKGCVLCGVMASAIRAHFTALGWDSEHIREITLKSWFVSQVNGSIGFTMDTRVPMFSRTAEVFYTPHPELFPLVTGDIDWSPIRERISQCRPCIRKISTSRAIPQGFCLIDVNDRRLVSDFSHGLKLGSDIRFVALSYVWGHATVSENNALLGGNGSRLSTAGGFELGKVPRAVEDAITVCRRLDRRFLWVDRYCIQQDGDSLEKKAQINGMGDIFSSAEFTIIHVTGTCIDDPIPGVSTTRDILQTRANICGLGLVSGYPDVHLTLVQSTWNRRGWTYQESVLCPRRLLFTSYEMWFEHDNEYRPYWREHYPEHTIKILDIVGSTGLLGHRLKNGYEDQFDAFCRHLKNYTARSLTLQSDAVDAFIGILAGLYAGDLGIYGLPVIDFDRAMLWHALEELPTSASGKESFPSWSWASAGSGVTIPIQPRRDFRGPLVHWTYRSPNGRLKAINSNPRNGFYRRGSPWRQAYLLAAWWNGCVEAPMPNDVKHASTPICSNREFAAPVQRYWIQRLCEHMVKRETCKECESYIEQRWPCLDQLWDDIKQNAGRQGVHEPSFGSCMTDPSLIENLHPALLTRAQTARFRIRKDPARGDYWQFVDAAGGRVGDIISVTKRTTATRIQAVPNGDSVECIAVSLISAMYSWKDDRYYVTDDEYDYWPGVNIIIIDQQEGCQTARRIGIGWIYLWYWVEANPQFRDIILE